MRGVVGVSEREAIGEEGAVPADGAAQTNLTRSGREGNNIAHRRDYGIRGMGRFPYSTAGDHTNRVSLASDSIFVNPIFTRLSTMEERLSRKTLAVSGTPFAFSFPTRVENILRRRESARTPT